LAHTFLNQSPILESTFVTSNSSSANRNSSAVGSCPMMILIKSPRKSTPMFFNALMDIVSNLLSKSSTVDLYFGPIFSNSWPRETKYSLTAAFTFSQNSLIPLSAISTSSLSKSAGPTIFLIASMMTFASPSTTDAANFSASSRITFPSFLRAAMIKSLYLLKVSFNFARMALPNFLNASWIFFLSSAGNNLSQASLICFPKLSKNSLI